MTSSLVNTSNLSNARQAVDVGYSWWAADVSISMMTQAHAREWRLFLGRVRGRVNSFNIPILPSDQHDATFTDRAQGAGSGYSLVTDGWPVSSLVLLAGDYVTVGTQLMVLDADVNTNISGVATLQFHSPLRGVVADNTALETKRPYLPSYFPQGSPALTLNVAQLQDGFSFSAMEAY